MEDKKKNRFSNDFLSIKIGRFVFKLFICNTSNLKNILNKIIEKKRFNINNDLNNYIFNNDWNYLKYKKDYLEKNILI
jgi:hypothetical protein